MKHILLIYPPFCTPASPPYSITGIAAFLKDNCDHKISVLDLNILFHKSRFPDYHRYCRTLLAENYKKEEYIEITRKFLEQSKKEYSKHHNQIIVGSKPDFLDESVKEIRSAKPDIAAFSIVYSSQAFYAYAIINELKKHGIQTIVGGPAITPILARCADKCFLDKDTLLEYLQMQEDLPESKHSTSNIKGSPAKNLPCNIQSKNLREDRLNKNQSNINSALDFSIYDLNDYFVPKPVIPIKTSSSCNYKKCAFCTHHLNSPYVEFPISNVKKAIAKSAEQGYRFFFFIDDMIPTGRLLKIAEAIKPLNIFWACQLRPSASFDRRALKQLHASGLRMILWGVESGCDRVLKLMRKGTTKEMIAQVLKDSHSAGIRNVAYIIFGFPTETKEEFIETMNFLLETDVDLISSTIFGLQQGSDAFSNPEKYSISSIIPEDRTILEPKITYSTTQGMSQEQASIMKKKYRKTIESLNKFPKQMNFFREHMLILLEKSEDIG
jgi:anaerobic magnesium-protoporphyrin IX monomethyl ester cyclase